MQTLEVLVPSGATEITRLHAPRLDSLDGKTVAVISNDSWQAHRVLPALKEQLERNYPSLTVLSHTEFPMGGGSIDTEEMVEALRARKVDGVIVGNAA